MKKLLLLYLLPCLLSTGVFAQNYELIPSFSSGAGSNNDVNAMGVDGNGDIFIGGDFTSYNGIARNYIVRINADGTLDGGFDPTTVVSNAVTGILVHSDNAVTVISAGALKRIDNTGAEFSGGTFSAASANDVIDAVVSEGTTHGVFIGGDFTTVGVTNTGHFAKLNADGSLNTTFNTTIGTGFNGRVRSIAVSGSGKILVGGDFTDFNGTPRIKVALLNSDGTLDTSLNAVTTFLNDNIDAVAFQDDGKPLVGTYNTSLGKGRLVRLQTTGISEFSTPIDGAFNLGSLGIGSIVTSGTNDIFVSILSAGGIVSIDYTTGAVVDIRTGNGTGGSTAAVNAMVQLSDGSIVLGGDFTFYNAIPVTNLAKIATCTVSIDTEPENTTACQTNNTTFAVVASGSGTLLYQWQESTDVFNYSDISDAGVYSGSTTATLMITGTTSGMNGNYYRCIVTDDDCSSTSGVSTLTVATQVVSDPTDKTACAGTNTSFPTGITGTSGGFQWQEDSGTGTFTDLVAGGVYTNVNSSSLLLSGVTVDMSGYKYRLKSTLCNPSGIFSASATLTVNEAPVITQAPVDAAVCVSGDASFSVVATSSNPITYQWQYFNGSIWTDLSNSAIYSGVTEAILLATGVDNTLAELLVATGDKVSVSIRCIVTSNGCDVNTGSKRLYIHVEPTINTQPNDYLDCVDVGATRSTTMSPILSFSDSGLPFQWEYDNGTGFAPISDNAVYSGTDKRILNFTDASTDHNGMYRVKISNCAAIVYSDEAAFTLDEKPVITLQPVNPQIQVCEGSEVEYTVAATGTNLTYQWKLSAGFDLTDNAIYTGTTSSKLEIDTKGFGNVSRQYRCVISSNGSCSTTSSRGNLRVYTTPIISGAPADRVACEGGDAINFVKSAAGFDASVHSYQWQEAFAGSDIFTDITDATKYSGMTSTSLKVLTPAYVMNGNQYRLKVNGCIAEVVSGAATLTVNQLPLITTSPQTQTVCKGEAVTFTAKSAIGTDVKYQWMADDGSGVYSNVTSSSPAGSDGFSTYTISSSSVAASLNGYKYKCVARSASPCASDQISESLVAILTVNEVTITTQPEQVTICRGENATFSITAQGEGLTYQWQRSGSDITDGGVYSGATTASLTITGATDLDGNKSYQCIVSGNCDAVTSAGPVLRVSGVDKPEIFADFNNPESPTLTVTNVSGDAYEWFLDGTSLGSGSSSLTIDKAGSYTVIVSVNGCPSEVSDAEVIIVTGVDKLLKDNTSIFPNPVKDQLNITLADIQFNTQIHVLSLDGKVKKSRIAAIRNNTIDVSDLSTGVYIVQIKNSENTTTYRIIKE